MEQKSLKVLDTNKTFFSKITTNITKMLIPTKVSFNNIIISIKRNSVVKNYTNYKDEINSDKKEDLLQKYEETYSLYLEAIDKYILDSLYKKVKNNTASNFEKNALSKYYTIVSLKEKQYLEYKYKKQEYLLNIDFESVSNQKKENTIKKYKEFYVSKMEVLYKGLLKNYSIQMASTKTNVDEIFDKIFLTLETYATEILPLIFKLKGENVEDLLTNKYEEYEQSSIGKLNDIDKICQKMTLINLSRVLFTHSLPPAAAEQCYKKLISEIINIITSNPNKNAYKMFIELIENYNKELLMNKIYWENSGEREDYKKFQEEYKSVQQLEGKKAVEQKEIIFLKGYLRYIRKNQINNEKMYRFVKEKLTEFGVVKSIKNKYKSEGAYKKIK